VCVASCEIDLRRSVLQNILWIVAVLFIIGAIWMIFRKFLKWGIILLVVAVLLGAFGIFA
jgi:Na+-translocating ferredoxin:NAD+ oxidoreductase RnfD subunit